MKDFKSCKEPEFLFISSPMRKAARAGWFSALGNAKAVEQHRHGAYAAWAKEISGGRR